ESRSDLLHDPEEGFAHPRDVVLPPGRASLDQPATPRPGLEVAARMGDAARDVDDEQPVGHLTVTRIVVARGGEDILVRPGATRRFDHSSTCRSCTGPIDPDYPQSRT